MDPLQIGPLGIECLQGLALLHVPPLKDTGTARRLELWASGAPRHAAQGSDR